MWKKTALICFLVNLLISCIFCQSPRLSKATAPIAYTVNIITNIETTLFDGVVTIEVKALEATRELTLHNQYLTITKLLAYDHCSKKSFQIIRNTTIENEDLYVLGFRDLMTVSCVYELMIQYNGKFRFDNSGFFLSLYEDGENLG